MQMQEGRNQKVTNRQPMPVGMCLAAPGDDSLAASPLLHTGKLQPTGLTNSTENRIKVYLNKYNLGSENCLKAKNEHQMLA